MEFWKEVRQLVLTGQLTQRATCRQYRLGWRTLKKILAHTEPPGYRKNQPRPKPKQEPFLPVIQQILEVGPHGASQAAAYRQGDHLAYLLQLSELELIERERKAAERRLKAARFPVAELLDEFDFAARPSVNKPLVLLLSKGEYLDKRESILLVGPSGTGKSHLATALGMAACAQGSKVRFFRVTELVTQFLEAKEERQLLRMRQSLGKLAS